MSGSVCYAMRKKIHFRDVFSSSLYLFDINFSEKQYFGLISCMILIKQFVSLTMASMEPQNCHLSSYHSNGC